MNTTQTPRITVPLGGEAHASARQFAAQQATPQKGKQVYINTLAVHAVHNYLKWLQIETDLGQGDSWHPGKRSLFNVADLVLPIGKLECRPVLPGETVCELPLEVREDRIGYVAVQFGERLDEVQLLGFVRAVDISDATEQILMADLQPLDVLLECIPANVVAPEPVLTASKVRVNLSRWLENTFEAGWQSVKALLNTEQGNLAFRSRRRDPAVTEVSVEGVKLIDLEMQMGSRSVALLLGLTPMAEQRVGIRVQLHPGSGETYLPPNLSLVLLSKSGATLQEVQSRSQDNFIQLKRFTYQTGKCFSIQVALDDVSIIENFVLEPLAEKRP